MITVEEIKSFSGFGSGGLPGEYFYSQGMQKTQFGISPKWAIFSDADSATLTHLTLNNWFSQGKFTNSYVYGFSSNGYLFRAQLGLTTWTEQRHVDSVPVPSHGNGLIFDQKNRLLYLSDRYLGMSSDGSSFDDDWKDFGASYETTDLRQADTYEDWVVMANKNAVALLNVTDDSFNPEALTLPSGLNVRCVRSGRNGILIGANFNNRGALILWEPNQLRSIAPWIWRNSNIQAIVPVDSGWLVFTKQEILFTTGYSIQPIKAKFPDNLINDSTILANLLPQGVEVQGDNVIFWGSGSNKYNRQKSGVYVLNLKTELFEFVPVANGVTYGVTGGAIFFDNSNFVHISYTTPTPDLKTIGRLTDFNPAQAVLISEQLGIGQNEKVAEGVKLTFGINSYQPQTPDMTFNVSVKVCNARRNIFGYAQTRAVSTQADVLKIDGSVASSGGYNKAKVGDEITILQGANAGQVRHVTAIANQGTNTETWTLDSVLPNNTESLVYLNVSPFKLAKKQTLSNVDELKELFFDVSNKIKGKKFLIKILLENMPSNLMVELMGGQFIYDELSLKR